MSREADIQAFYRLLKQLEQKSAPRILAECHGRMKWPQRGVYFFFEDGELRRSGERRVVRIGTHALTARSRTMLWTRLRQHRGGEDMASGNHRGSVFRLLAGEAMLLKEADQSLPTWGIKGVSNRAIKDLERNHEARVSKYLGSMRFLALPVLDSSSPESERGVIERNSIALLSRYHDTIADPPGKGWLGKSSGRERVRRSGLWNNNHVDEAYDPKFLKRFSRLVDAV